MRRSSSAKYPLYSSPRLPKRSGAASGLFCLLLCALALACGSDPETSKAALTTTTGVTCTDGAVACGDSCAHLDSSAAHCGACDTLCSSDSICDRGQCRPAAAGCSAGLSLCGSDCIDVTSSDEHCGSCEQACAPEASCGAGSCVCPTPLAACGDSCVDTASDDANCGACGNACVGGQTCEAGSCVCPVGATLCSTQGLTIVDDAVAVGQTGQSCVDTSVDVKHCGACGNACAGGQTCEQGSCVCPAGQTLCGDRCADPQSDTANCGACGSACGSGQLCNAGTCVCPQGQSECNGACVDVQSDPANCGACGTRCGLGEGCDNGACEAGALGEDGCQGLALDVSITEVAAYQTIKLDLARGNQVAASPTGLVAQRPTLLRVFVTPGDGWVERELSARLFLQEGEEADATVAIQYSESTLSVAAQSTDDDRATTFEFKLPPERLTPNTRFAVEVVECGGGTGTGAEQIPRYPATASADFGALDTGPLKIHLVPMRANGQLPDTSDDALALMRSAFLDTYPVATVEFSVGEPFDVADAEDWNANLDALRALRQQENPPRDVYYYGMLKPTDNLGQFCGRGCVAGVGYVGNPQFNGQQRASMGLAYNDSRSAFTMLHEVGHNHGRNHAPCAPGNAIAGVDPNFPQPDGAVGVYGYDALGDQILPPDFTDLMGYCDNQWLSAYTYGGIFNAVLTVNQVQASVIVDPSRVAPWRVMLVDDVRGARWGHAYEEAAVASGEPEKALVYDAAGTLLEEVEVFRTAIGDLDAASIEVPAPKPGWHSIQVSGAPAIEFGAQR